MSSEESSVQKVTAERISPDRVDTTGSDDLMRLFAGGGLTALAAAITAMGIYMHYLQGY
jgi:hypothetical protein